MQRRQFLRSGLLLGAAGAVPGVALAASQLANAPPNITHHKDTAYQPKDNLEVCPLEINFGIGLVPLFDSARNEDRRDISERIQSIRREIAEEFFDFSLPLVRIRDSLHLEQKEYEFYIDGQSVAKWSVFLNRWFAITNNGITKKISGSIEVIEPAFGTPALWIEEKDKELAQSYGYTVVEPQAVISTHFLATIRKHIKVISFAYLTSDTESTA
jgi:flagellar biosynthesis protein FlhA